ncbi:GGDEF domain-containing protein [Arthrobacter sp. OVS8]|nr:GGDEF domain-containing protein [Arthrobacter sp. OVS8]
MDGPEPRDLMIFFAAPERRRYERELASAHRQLEDAEAERALLLQEAHHRALHDPLTGLPNRRQLEESLLAALARAGEQRHRVGVLFCDVNNFKNVNDTLGHAAGDRVLEHVARMLAQAVRDADTVTRYSGDEFVVLIPGWKTRRSSRPWLNASGIAWRAPSLSRRPSSGWACPWARRKRPFRRTSMRPATGNWPAPC